MTPIRYFCDYCGDEYNRDDKRTVFSPFWGFRHDETICGPCTELAEQVVKERDEDMSRAIQERVAASRSGNGVAKREELPLADSGIS